MTSCERLMVGMSGGVDSSVTAALLRDAGHAIEGVFMKNWEEAGDGPCPAAVDYEDARAVARRLEIPLLGTSFADEYRERVFEHFLREYAAGRTPNPDVLCNREIKFRVLLDFARERGAAAVATGHYARRAWHDGRWHLLRGRDAGKDQSYFLYLLTQDQLEGARFPLGELTKAEVRDKARALGLETAEKKDSTGICFIGERDFRGFLGQYLATEPGPMVTPEGDTVGTHHGLAHYTLGQRQGLGLGGMAGYDGRPWFVLGKNQENNTLYVGQGGDHPWLQSRELIASEVHWIAGEAPPLPLDCTARTRYRQADAPARVVPLDGRDDAVRVVFDQPQRAVTPGQAVVFYTGEECLGGATIDTTDAPGEQLT
ncbi:MAG: tRNA 2-thiouridine(34) synthase MnmA [Pseudomonadota bacterium]